MATKVKQRIDEFRNKKDAIRFSPDLTPEGKDKHFVKLKEEIAAARRQALSELGQEWESIRSEFGRLDKRKTKAQEAEAARWDYNRLRFEMDRARLAVENARTSSNPFGGVTPVSYLGGQYEDAVRSHDLVKQRAWGEVAGLILSNFGKDAGGTDLARRLRGDLEKIMTTEDLQRIKSEEHELVMRSVEAERETQAARSFFDGELGIVSEGGFANNSEFRDLKRGVHISQAYQSPSPEDEAAGAAPGFVFSVDISES